MKDGTRLQPVPFLVVGLILILYAGYFVWNEIGSAQSLYTEKQKELISLEKKQEQISHLKEELEKISENRTEVSGSLITRDDALKVIERIEEVAKREGLLYDVRILGELTKEDIDSEILAIRRSRRGGQDEAISEALKKLPNINFEVSLTGGYSGIVRFLEGVGTLPYYTQVDRLNLLSKKTEPAIEEAPVEKPSAIEAKINIIVFTR